MKIVLAYIVVTHGPIAFDLASRFVGTYIAFPPGVEHETVIVCNGGPLAPDLALLFSPLRCELLPRANDGGYDISGYQDVARLFPSDMQVCFGESVYFFQAGWLQRLAFAWTAYGEGMYGCYSSNLIRAHLNTTAFATAPKFLRGYPLVRNQSARYEFEHGKMSLWRRLEQFKAPTKLVTWDGVWNPRQWRQPSNILNRGDQSNCLVWSVHTDRYRAADLPTKISWAKASDSPFQ